MKQNKLINMCAINLMLMAGLSVSSVQASDVSYNYLEGRYIVDAEANNVDGDGLRIGGSVRIRSDLYLFSNYETLDLDFNNDIDTFNLGGGYILPLNAKWDANFSMALVNRDVNNNDDTGFSLAAGVRGMMASNIEGRASLTYIDVNDNDTYITLGGDYFFSKNLSVGIEADLSGDLDTLSIGARYHF